VVRRGTWFNLKIFLDVGESRVWAVIWVLNEIIGMAKEGRWNSLYGRRGTVEEVSVLLSETYG